MQQTTWTSHITHALEHDFEAHTTYLGDGRFVVESATRPGEVHHVRALGSATICDCEAGKYGRKCWHQAGALLIGGYLDAQPVVTETATPEPMPVKAADVFKAAWSKAKAS